MEDIKSYFLDTYAIIEIIKENKNYKKFYETLNFTSIMNLLEVHYIISRNFDEKKADLIIEKLKKIILEPLIEDVKEASRFRLKNSKNKFSYIDCLGYAIALNREMKFLTGDKEFEKMKNVEFVK
jgi:predicted nucleic acid-binding protein